MSAPTLDRRVSVIAAVSYFPSAEDAARAYDAAAMRLRGHFAFTNFRYFE